MHDSLADMNVSVLSHMSVLDSEIQTPAPSDAWLVFIHGICFQLLSQITIWRILVLFLVLGNIKNVPLIWHVSIVHQTYSEALLIDAKLRIVNAFRFCTRTARPKVPITSAHIFQPLITTSHAPLMEIDFNLHSKFPVASTSSLGMIIIISILTDPHI